MTMNYSKISNFAASFLFTKRCRFCRRLIDIRHDICEKCKNNIYRIEGDICFKCGHSQKDCSCRGKSKFYTSICAPYYYDGAAKEAIKALKFIKDTLVVEDLVKDMADCFETHYANMDFDLCTFVPSHKNEEKERGYNQAQLIAESLAKNINVPYADVLEKRFETPPQHTLTEAMRSGNLLGTIFLKEQYNNKINDMRILLCDDVKTTGSTLNECAKTLLINGAAEVRCITVCIAHNSSSS